MYDQRLKLFIDLLQLFQPNNGFFGLLFSCHVIGEFKKPLNSDWLFCFTCQFSLAEKKMCFRAKDSAIRE